MADTIITPGSPREDGSSSAVWAVALVVIVLLFVGAFIWFQRNGGMTPPAEQTGTNINVTLPPAPTPSPTPVK